MYDELDLCCIKSNGWIDKFLENQADGLTGNICRVGKPFSENYWGNIAQNGKRDADYFLGGMDINDDAWVPYEQTGYWIDGLIRVGYLSNNEKLVEQAREKIYSVLKNASQDGYLGPVFLKNGMTWAHSVYFRSWMAEYGVTHDNTILEALTKHFLRIPLKSVYERDKNSRIIAVRNVADLEIVLWVYSKTGDKRLLRAAEESYDAFNLIYSDDSNAQANEEMRDVTLPGMLENRKVCRNHGVTYCEICKIAAIMYKYTKKELYRKAAINAFEKLYRDQMLIDGVNSSTEYLNGNEYSDSMHETCDISDLTWALGYLYMITEDTKYGDRIEDAVFNAGLGCVDDEFKGEQYFSCPNQVICDDRSNSAFFYRGSDWNSYAPKYFLGCCAGNVHRFMPNYVARSWLKGDNELFAALYAPSNLNTTINGTKVNISEITNYPFENSVKFIIKTEKAVNFTLTLRIPSWATKTKISVNGEEIEYNEENKKIKLFRKFNSGDEIIISFTDSIQLIENAYGVSVKKGALLYALPLKEKVVINGLRELNNPDYPHYSLYTDEKWNYAFDFKRKDEIDSFQSGCVTDTPWKSNSRNLFLKIPAREAKDWKIRTVKNGKRRLSARGNVQKIGYECRFTPRVRAVNKHFGEETTITLVPYCSTRLRIAIFPTFK